MDVAQIDEKIVLALAKEIARAKAFSSALPGMTKEQTDKLSESEQREAVEACWGNFPPSVRLECVTTAMTSLSFMAKHGLLKSNDLRNLKGL